jgi:hypothetical protein
MILQIVHWLLYAYYIYLFGYASLLKVFQHPPMMQGMEAFGFNRTWTLFIGYGELIGFIGLLTGIFIHQVKNASILYLFPFSVGALMVHFAHSDYRDFYDALYCCAASILLLASERHFRVVL